MKAVEGNTALDNELELTALTNMLKRGHGARLGFVRINHVSLRERIVKEIQQRLPEKQFLEVTLDPKLRTAS